MISVSEFTRRRMLEELTAGELPPERIHVVPNCVDAAHYLEPREVGDRPWHGQSYTLSIGELMRDNSPPDATLDNGILGCPGFAVN